MRPRTIIIEENPEIRQLLSCVLSRRGHEVQAFAAPQHCPLFPQAQCTCPQDHPCADILIASVELPPLGGFEFLRRQQQMGCRVSISRKLLLSFDLTDAEIGEAKALGCKIISKPFRLKNLIGWIIDCEKSIAACR